MSDPTRRELVALLGMTAAAACGPRARGKGAEGAHQADSTSAAMQAPRFFTPHEFATVTLLADLIIPADERSGSASEAGVPAYLDFALREVEDDAMRLAMRGGLAWLDAAAASVGPSRTRHRSSAARSSTTSRGRPGLRRPSRTAPRSSATSATSSPPRSGRARSACGIFSIRATWPCRSGPGAPTRRSGSSA